MTKLYKHKYSAYAISSQGRKIIESDIFTGLNYVIEGGEVLIFDRGGCLKVDINKVWDFVDELLDIVSLWSDVKTVDYCPVVGANKRVQSEVGTP